MVEAAVAGKPHRRTYDREQFFTDFSQWNFRPKNSERLRNSVSFLNSIKDDDQKTRATFEGFKKYQEDRARIAKTKDNELQMHHTGKHNKSKTIVSSPIQSQPASAATHAGTNMSLPSSPASALSVPRRRAHVHKRSQLLNKDEDLTCCLKLNTANCVRLGMKKAALNRQNTENLGMVSFNKTR